MRRIVQRYLPEALSYPAYSAHRRAYVDMIYTEYDSLMIGASALERGRCDIVLKYAIEDVELKAEGR